MRARKQRVVDGMQKLILLLVLLGIGSTAAAEETKVEREFDFDIPQQAMNTALIEFAEQADLTLVFPDDLVRGKFANAVIGRYSRQKRYRQTACEYRVDPNVQRQSLVEYFD